MSRRAFGLGALGWIVPGIVALAIGTVREMVGDPLLAVITWWGLGTLGCVVAGVIVAAGIRAGRTKSDAFWSGLAGVSTAWIAAVVVSWAIDLTVRWLDISGATFVIPIPFVLGYIAGFGLTVMVRKRET